MELYYTYRDFFQTSLKALKSKEKRPLSAITFHFHLLSRPGLGKLMRPGQGRCMRPR